MSLKLVARERKERKERRREGRKEGQERADQAVCPGHSEQEEGLCRRR